MSKYCRIYTIPLNIILVSPYTDWLHHFVSSPPVSWCVVGVLAQYGCRLIIQVMLHIGGGEEFPPFYVKHFKVPRKALYKYNKWLLLLLLAKQPWCVVKDPNWVKSHVSRDAGITYLLLFIYFPKEVQGFTWVHFPLCHTYIVHKHKHTVLKSAYRTWPIITSAYSSHWQRKATWHKWIKGGKEKETGWD